LGRLKAMPAPPFSVAIFQLGFFLKGSAKQSH